MVRKGELVPKVILISINMKGEVTFIKIEKGKDNSHGGVISVLKNKTIVNNKVLID